MPRLLLILPTSAYQADAYMAAVRKLGVELTVASEVDSAFSKPDYEGLLTLDLCDPAAAAGRVEDFATRHPIEAVFGVDDRTAIVAAHIAARLHLPYSPIDAVEAAGDKLKQRRRLHAAGSAVPPFMVVSLADPHVQSPTLKPAYPVVLKPLALSASRGVIRANDDVEFAAAAETIREILAEERAKPTGGNVENRMLVEQFVPGREFAVEGYVFGGVFHEYAIFEKPDPLDGPFFEETIYLTPPRIGEAGKRVIGETVRGGVSALGLTHGPIHAEVRVSENAVWILEIAARPIGGKCGQALRFDRDGSASLEWANLSLAFNARAGGPRREEAASGVMMIPIPRAGVLVGVDGVEAALGVPTVTDIVITVPSGARLRRLPYESRYLGFIFARAESSDLVDRALRAAHAELDVRITDGAEPAP